MTLAEDPTDDIEQVVPEGDAGQVAQVDPVVPATEEVVLPETAVGAVEETVPILPEGVTEGGKGLDPDYSGPLTASENSERQLAVDRMQDSGEPIPEAWRVDMNAGQRERHIVESIRSASGFDIDNLRGQEFTGEFLTERAGLSEGDISEAREREILVPGLSEAGNWQLSNSLWTREGGIEETVPILTEEADAVTEKPTLEAKAEAHFNKWMPILEKKYGKENVGTWSRGRLVTTLKRLRESVANGNWEQSQKDLAALAEVIPVDVNDAEGVESRDAMIREEAARIFGQVSDADLLQSVQEYFDLLEVSPLEHGEKSVGFMKGHVEGQMTTARAGGSVDHAFTEAYRRGLIDSEGTVWAPTLGHRTASVPTVPTEPVAPLEVVGFKSTKVKGVSTGTIGGMDVVLKRGADRSWRIQDQEGVQFKDAASKSLASQVGFKNRAEASEFLSRNLLVGAEASVAVAETQVEATINDLASRHAKGEKFEKERDVANFKLYEEEVLARSERRSPKQEVPVVQERETEPPPRARAPVRQAVLNRLKELLPWAKVQKKEMGGRAGIHIDLGGDKWVKLESLDPDTIDRVLLRESYTEEELSDEEIDALEVLGGWELSKSNGDSDSVIGIVRLLENLGEQSAEELDASVWEEVVHVARHLGLWTESEWKALENKHTDATHDTDLRKEEAVAGAVGANLAQRDRLMNRIKEFLGRIVKSVYPGFKGFPAGVAERLLTEEAFWVERGVNIKESPTGDAGSRYSVRFPRGTKRAVTYKSIDDARRSNARVANAQVVKELEDIWGVPRLMMEKRWSKKVAASYRALRNMVYTHERSNLDISITAHAMGEAFANNTKVWTADEMIKNGVSKADAREIQEELQALSWDDSIEGGFAEFFRQYIMQDEPEPGLVEGKRYDKAVKDKAKLQGQIDLIEEDKGVASEKQLKRMGELDNIIKEEKADKGLFTRTLEARTPVAYRYLEKWIEGNSEQADKLARSRDIVDKYREQREVDRWEANRTVPGKTEDEKETWTEWISWHVWEPYLEWMYRMHSDKIHFAVQVEKILRRSGLKIGKDEEGRGRAAMSDVFRFWYGKETQWAMDAFNDGIRDPLALGGEELEKAVSDLASLEKARGRVEVLRGEGKKPSDAWETELRTLHDLPEAGESELSLTEDMDKRLVELKDITTVVYTIDDDPEGTEGNHGIKRALALLDHEDMEGDLHRLSMFMHAEHAEEQTGTLGTDRVDKRTIVLPGKKPGYDAGMDAHTAAAILKERRGDTRKAQIKSLEGKKSLTDREKRELEGLRKTQKKSAADLERHETMAGMLRQLWWNIQRLRRKHGILKADEFDRMEAAHEKYYPLIRQVDKHEFSDRHVNRFQRFIKKSPGTYSYYRSATGGENWTTHVNPIVATLIKTNHLYKAISAQHKTEAMFRLLDERLQEDKENPWEEMDGEADAISDYFIPVDDKDARDMSHKTLENTLDKMVKKAELDQQEAWDIYNATVLRDDKATEDENITKPVKASIRALWQQYNKDEDIPEDATNWVERRDQMIEQAALKGVEDGYIATSSFGPVDVSDKVTRRGAKETVLSYQQYSVNIKQKDGSLKRYTAWVDPRLVAAANSSPHIPQANWYKLIAQMTHIRKAGAVYINPSFAVMDWIRNPLQYAMGSRYRSPHNALGAAYWWSMQLHKHSVGDRNAPYNEVVAEFYRGSGKMGGFYGELSRDEVDVNHKVNQAIMDSKDPVVGFTPALVKKLKQTGIWDMPKNPLRPLQALFTKTGRTAWLTSIDNMRSFVTMSDSAARIAEYYAAHSSHGYEMREVTGKGKDKGKYKWHKKSKGVDGEWDGQWVLEQPPQWLRERSALAANESVLDFPKQGEWGEKMNKISMFWSAAVNASDKLMRIHVETLASTKAPGSGFARMLTDERRDVGHLAEWYIAGTTMALAYWALVHDEDWYVELPSHVKNMYWVVPMGEGSYVYIAKGYDAGHVFNATESALNAMATEDKSAFSEAFWHAMDNNMAIFPASITPAHLLSPVRAAMQAGDIASSISVFGPLVSAGSNWDFFRHKRIEGMRLKHLQARHRWTPTTLWTSKMVGKVTGSPAMGNYAVGPVKFEHAANQWTGSSYGRYSKLVDAAKGDRALTWRDLPGMHSLLRDRESSRSLQFFYDKQWPTIKETYNSAKAGHIPMNSTLSDAYHINNRYSGILRDIFKEVENIRDSKERLRAGQKYAIGMAREATGEREREKFPTIWRGTVPPGIKKVREKVMGTLIRNATMPLLDRADREPGGPSLKKWNEMAADRKALIRTAILFLRRTGLKRREVVRLMSKYDKDTPTYVGRLTSAWRKYGGG
jgi:hypothetical protein